MAVGKSEAVNWITYAHRLCSIRPNASCADLARALLDENVLGESTKSSRETAYRHLETEAVLIRSQLKNPKRRTTSDKTRGKDPENVPTFNLSNPINDHRMTPASGRRAASTVKEHEHA